MTTILKYSDTAGSALPGPERLAQVVADVSGLSHWNREAAAAVSELKHTREAIVSIESNATRLVR